MNCQSIYKHNNVAYLEMDQNRISFACILPCGSPSAARTAGEKDVRNDDAGRFRTAIFVGGGGVEAIANDLRAK
jgi:hypothetical protein